MQNSLEPNYPTFNKNFHSKSDPTFTFKFGKKKFDAIFGSNFISLLHSIFFMRKFQNLFFIQVMMKMTKKNRLFIRLSRQKVRSKARAATYLDICYFWYHSQHLFSTIANIMRPKNKKFRIFGPWISVK